MQNEIDDNKISEKNEPVYIDSYGHKLTTDEKGLLTNIYGEKFMVGKDGEVHQLKSPLDASTIYLNENGEYVSDYSSVKFHVDENGKVIPLVDPITHDGTAHIENGQLVSDVTGERYDIDQDGHILTPEEIENLQRATELNNNIEQMEQDGTIDEWLEQREASGRDPSVPLTEEEIKEFIDGASQESQHLIDEVIQESKDIGIRADEITDVNREINQTEKDYIQGQQPQQNIDVGMSIGE